MNRSSRRLQSPHIGRKTLENSRLSGMGTGLNAHRLVAETAVGLAQSCYEAWMGVNNELYRVMRRELTNKQIETVFIAKVAPTLLEEARLVLTDMLSMGDAEVPKSLKDEIAEALILDTDFRANRVRAAEHMPSSLIH
jgi:hypothetical protein